jgi:hypothetical protein
MNEIKFPNVTYQMPDLLGPSGNAFVLIGQVTAAIRAQEGTAAANLFADESMEQTSYGALLDYIKRTVTVI